MQPGGHRFEPGILHQVQTVRLESIESGSVRWKAGRAETLPANPEKFVALLQLNILQTVVFSDHKAHAVCKELTRTTSTTNDQLPTCKRSWELEIGNWELSALVSSFYGQATKGVR